MEKLMMICTCDDNCDTPCPAHCRENALQDENFRLSGKIKKMLKEAEDKLLAEAPKAGPTSMQRGHAPIAATIER
jgi:hypothetical protein